MYMYWYVYAPLLHTHIWMYVYIFVHMYMCMPHTQTESIIHQKVQVIKVSTRTWKDAYAEGSTGHPAQQMLCWCTGSRGRGSGGGLVPLRPWPEAVQRKGQWTGLGASEVGLGELCSKTLLLCYAAHDYFRLWCFDYAQECGRAYM